jgi:hypothetical protein
MAASEISGRVAYEVRRLVFGQVSYKPFSLDFVVFNDE